MSIGIEKYMNKCNVPWGHKFNYFDYCAECGEERPW
jgi:hypothetical protein